MVCDRMASYLIVFGSSHMLRLFIRSCFLTAVTISRLRYTRWISQMVRTKQQRSQTTPSYAVPVVNLLRLASTNHAWPSELIEQSRASLEFKYLNPVYEVR